MRNVLMAAAAVFMLVGTAFAEPVVLSDAQLDEMRAGRLLGSFDHNIGRVINLGSYSLVFDGTGWKVVWK